MGMGMLRSCAGTFTGKEGRIQGLVGQAPPSQTVGSLLITLWLAKPNIFFFYKKSVFSEFTLMEKCISLLLIKCICQSQKIDKPYHNKHDFTIKLI